MVHKGLEDEVAEGRLTAESCAGVDHPHRRCCQSEDGNGLFDLREFRVKFGEGNEHRHDRADIEGELIDADARIAVGKRHYEEIDNVKSDRKIGENMDQAGFCRLGFVSEEQGEKNRAAEDYEKI